MSESYPGIFVFLFCPSVSLGTNRANAEISTCTYSIYDVLFIFECMVSALPTIFFPPLYIPRSDFNSKNAKCYLYLSSCIAQVLCRRFYLVSAFNNTDTFVWESAEKYISVFLNFIFASFLFCCYFSMQLSPINWLLNFGSQLVLWTVCIRLYGDYMALFRLPGFARPVSIK